MTGTKRTVSIIRRIAAAVLTAVLVLMLAGCSGSKAAESAAAADLESLRYVELDPGTDAELESLLSDQGKEYFEMFLGKAGEFEYKITGSEEGGADGNEAVVSVRVTTYAFDSEYLRTWSDFLEQSEAAAGGNTSEYDTAKFYEELFRNLSSIQEKDYTEEVDVVCTQADDGTWQTDAGTNKKLRNAILGGMLDEMTSLAGLEN